MVLDGKTNFFLRKKMVLDRKTIFFLGKTKKTIFLEFGRIVSQKMFFCFFWYSLGKVGFGLGGYSAAVDFVLTSNLNELTDMSC